MVNKTNTKYEEGERAGGQAGTVLCGARLLGVSAGSERGEGAHSAPSLPLVTRAPGLCRL